MCIRLCICVCTRSLLDFNNKIIITKISTPFHGRARERPAWEYVSPPYTPANMCVYAPYLILIIKLLSKTVLTGARHARIHQSRQQLYATSFRICCTTLKRKLALESHYGTHTNTAAGGDIAEGDSAGGTEFLQYLSVVFHLLVAWFAISDFASDFSPVLDVKALTTL